MLKLARNPIFLVFCLLGTSAGLYLAMPKNEISQNRKPDQVELVETPNPLLAPYFEQAEYNFELIDPDLAAKPAAAGFARVEWPVLNFSPSVGAETHTLELSRFQDFRARSEFALDQFTWTWSQAEPGKFFARIRAQRGEESLYSAVSALRIILSAPVIGRLTVKEQAASDPVVQAKMNKHELGDRLEIQIAKDSTFKSPLVFKDAFNSIQFTASEPGELFVRARYINKQDWPISRFSKMSRIEVLPWAKAKAQKVFASEPVPVPTLMPEPIPEPTPKETALSVWTGLGTHDLTIKQSNSANGNLTSFGQARGVNLSLGLRYQFEPEHAVQFELSNSPGEVGAEKFSWRSALLEYQYRFIENKSLHVFALFGLQLHQLPFVRTNLDSTTTLLENEFKNFSLGAHLKLALSEQVEFLSFLRMQQVLHSASNGGNFDASSGMMMDGSVGIRSALTERSSFEFFWVSQFQKIDYDFSGETVYSGQQSFANSALQFRLRVDWP